MKNHGYLFIGLTAFFAILLLNGCGEAEKAEPPAPKAASVEVRFTTEDGVEIYADYYKGKGDEPPAVILLHMRGADRKSWNPIIDKIVAKGYAVLIARDGNQGLAMAEREDPDLVILDMMMPKRSGFLVLERLRRTRPVPMRVIMITANEGSRHKAYAEMLGVDDYIRKPFPMDRLVDSVKRLLA